MHKYFDKELFGKRLLSLMKDNKDTTYSLGKYLSLSSSTISRYTSGEMEPKIPTIHKISEKYGVNPAWLMGIEEADKYIEGMNEAKKIPIVGIIAAGVPIFAQEYIEGYEYISDNIRADFCLKVKGDSMIGARILDGDLVYIRKQPEVENGEIAAVLVDEEDATLKRFYKLDGSIILRAENPNIPDQTFNKKETKRISVIGKAVFFKSEVR